jgi:hypothetical protein
MRTKKEPNISFVGDKDGKRPLRQIVNGDQTIKLPANQSKPFFHKDAKVIIRLYGWLYKPVTAKG